MTAKVVWPPAVAVELAGAESAKSGGGATCTTSVAPAEWLRVPLVPTTVNGYVPAMTAAVVVIVSVEPLKLGVAPDGRPLAVKVTGLEKPLFR